MDPFSHNRESTYTSLTRSDSDTSSLLTTSQSIHHNHPTTTKTTYKAYRPGLVHQHSIASIQPSIIEETPSPPRSRPGSRNSHAFSRLVGPPSLNERGSANGALLGEGSERVLWAEARHVRQTSEGSNDVRLDAALLRESNVSGELSRPVSKQYFRNARRIRSEWRTGRMRRFPCRGIGGLFVVGLCKSQSLSSII